MGKAKIDDTETSLAMRWNSMPSPCWSSPKSHLYRKERVQDVAWGPHPQAGALTEKEQERVTPEVLGSLLRALQVFGT